MKALGRPPSLAGDQPAAFAFAFLLIAVLGAGSWALDNRPILRRQREEARS